MFFADDLKIFRVIKSVLDCVALQIDIDALSRWCKENGMCVNINKCKVITFSRCWIPINHLYNIDTAPLERVQSIRDLGVIMDCKLRFNEHISTVTAKAFSVLGFIRRNASQFTDVHTLKALFCALVRSILEYAAPLVVLGISPAGNRTHGSIIQTLVNFRQIYGHNRSTESNTFS